MSMKRRRNRGSWPFYYLHQSYCKDHRHDGKCITALVERIRSGQHA